MSCVHGGYSARKYRHHNQNLHVSPDKEQVEGCSLSVPIAFSATATESKMSYRRMSIRTKRHRICTSLSCRLQRTRSGGEKVSAKEVITKNDLKTFHTDLERYLDSFRDWHFEVVNEATKDGNKEIAELKKQTAHEEVLKAQQEATQARQRALQEQESIKPLVEQKNALRGEIETLQTEKRDFDRRRGRSH